MTIDDLAVIVDEVLQKDTTEGILIERKLFKESILQQQALLRRTPSTYQIEQCWKRWKRERNIDVNAEPNIDTKTLYKRK